MSLIIRIVLIVASVWFTAYILHKVRVAKMHIDDTIFWIFFTLVIFLFGIFPQIPTWMAEVLKIQSPVNFVYLVIIFLLIIKIFALTIKLSKVEVTVQKLVQELALKEVESKEK